ncbi:hypothetical protein Mpsy_1098 [Methanolobus psychrophilus R15]|nr:hypothetical protein Mpsy_1098 [Methanolobus psychrophilus R15]
MSDNFLSDAGITLGEGFTGGIAFLIGLKFGVPIDEGGLGLFVAEEMLEASKQVAPTANYSSAESLLMFVSFFIFVISIIALFVSITRIGDWKIGALLYGIGFIFGAIIILSALP